MKEEWLFHGAVVPIDVETTAALVAEIKRLIDVIGGMALAQLEQEPVAVRYDFDGYGYQYIDSGSGSDWQTRVQGEPLYTAPQIKVGCAECGVNGNHALYCVKCAEKYLKEKNIR